jgi:hypothetical protein
MLSNLALSVVDSTTPSYFDQQIWGLALHKTRTISELVENPTDGFFAWREKVVADEKMIRNRSAGDKDKRHAKDGHDPASRAKMREKF